jgi:hypothetical protein
VFLHDESSWPHGSPALGLQQVSRLGDGGETFCSSESIIAIGQTRSCRSLTSRPSPQFPCLISPRFIQLHYTVCAVLVSTSLNLEKLSVCHIEYRRRTNSRLSLKQSSYTRPRTPTSPYIYAIQSCSIPSRQLSRLHLSYRSWLLERDSITLNTVLLLTSS